MQGLPSKDGYCGLPSIRSVLNFIGNFHLPKRAPQVILLVGRAQTGSATVSTLPVSNAPSTNLVCTSDWK
jgi:hypothetical protein